MGESAVPRILVPLRSTGGGSAPSLA